MTTGHQLYLIRAQHRLTAKAVAEAMGVYHTRVSQLEHAEEVSDVMADRFRAAVSAITGLRPESLSAGPGAAGPSGRQRRIARKLRALADELES